MWAVTLALAEKWGSPPSVVRQEDARWITRQDLLDELRDRNLRKEGPPSDAPDTVTEEDGWVHVVHPVD